MCRLGALAVGRLVLTPTLGARTAGAAVFPGSSGKTAAVLTGPAIAQSEAEAAFPVLLLRVLGFFFGQAVVTAKPVLTAGNCDSTCCQFVIYPTVLVVLATQLFPWKRLRTPPWVLAR